MHLPTLTYEEELRLRKVQEYEVLDTEYEPAFDDITRLAALVCKVPIAVITLVDSKRLWFKSAFGIDVREMPRDDSFCSYAIENNVDLFVVEDAALDERFQHHALVTFPPHIRFYAGAPLVTPDGVAIGTLCVLDQQPRNLGEEQRITLKLLANQVVTQLELKRALRSNDVLSQQCHLALTQAADGIHLFDLEGKILAVNPKFCEMTGRSEDELLTMNVQQLVQQDDLRTEPIRFAEMRSGKSFASERRFVKADGGVIDVELSIRMIDGVTVSAIVRDITERKAIEKQLRESEQLFRDFAEQSLALFCMHDLDGVLSRVNPAAAEALGYTVEEMIGRNLADFMVPEESVLMPHYMAVLREKGRSKGDMWVVRRDGERRVWSFNNIFVNVGGPDPHVIGCAQDSTDIRRNETELKNSQQIFDSYINNSPAVIFMKDFDGRYVTVNRSFEKFLNLTVNEVYGKDDFELLPKEIAEVVRANDLSVLQTGKTIEAIEMVPDAEGNEHYWVSHKFLIETATGKKLLGGIAVDITERKQLEIDLESARDAALESARLKSAFLTNVSHELRTPMNGVIGMTELLLETPLDRTQREYADTIRQSGDALLTVINDILDLAKIEAGKLRFEAMDFNIRETIDSTVELLAPRAYQKGLEIASLIATDIPPVLRGDAGRLRQVLTNLIGNAIKYTEHGEIGIRVDTIKNERKNVALRFSVSDTGIGIAPENLRHLFQPFGQVDDSMTRRFGGTGLGLVISKQIVEMMNGEITVESNVGKGSTFTFTGNFEHSIEGRRKDAPPRASLEGRRVVIADDKKIMRENLGNYAQLWDMRTRAVANGEELLAALQSAAASGEPFDVAVVDMNLPDWEGFDLARRIKSDDHLSRTRIVLTTAYGQRGDAAEAKNSGVSAYLTKPIRGGQFFDCLATVLKELDSPDAAAHSDSSPLVTRHTLREAKALSTAKKIAAEKRDVRLLVVEDNDINRRLLLLQLEQLGIKADIATDGVDALEKVEKKDYELILMDCQMPRLDGYGATREIRRREDMRRSRGERVSALKIVALTAHSLSGEREKCIDAGMDEYLAKPVKLGELSAMIKRFTSDESPSAPSAASHEPSIDDFNAEIIQLYLLETGHRIEAIKAAMAAGDATEVARLAHAVRGNALAINDLASANIAGRLENLAQNSGLEHIPILLADLHSEIVALTERFAGVVK